MSEAVPWFLFLDDQRIPRSVKWLTLPDGPWVTARDYTAFVQAIETRGLPAHISFDHDLGDCERSGYDCANWLVAYCLDRDLDLPQATIHSKNPVGAANIRSLLAGYSESRA